MDPEAEYLSWVKEVSERCLVEQPVDLLQSAAATGDTAGILMHLAHIKEADMFGYTALHAAAENGQHDAVSLLLQHGAHVHVDAATVAEQDTPLHLAVLGGHTDIVQQLISAGADVHAVDADGCTALHIAAEAGISSIVQLLLEAGSDPNAFDSGNETPLHLASEQGHSEVVQQLLAHGAEVSVLCTDNHFTPLHHAAAQGHSVIANQLLAADTIAAAAGRDKYSLAIMCGEDGRHVAWPPSGMAVDEAVRYNQAVLVKRLLAELASQDRMPAAMDGLLELSIHHGSTACTELLLAAGALGADNAPAAAMKVAFQVGIETWIGAKAGALTAVQQLLEAGVSPDQKTGNKGKTLLHRAAKWGDIGMARFLLAAGASLTAQDDAGRTALHRAVDVSDVLSSRHAMSRRAMMVRLLLEEARRRGATALSAMVNASDKDGFTALSCAVTSSCTSTFHMLVNAGADLKGANARGDTILHAAARLASNGEQFVRCALKAGVDCSMVNKEQLTPLHIAAGYNNVAAAQLMLQAGAAVDAADGRGRTPLHFAVYKDHHAVTQTLLAAGATVNALDTNQDTPLHFAAIKGATAAAQLLLKVGGADVRVANINSATPLHVAARRGHVDVARLLLEEARRRGATALSAMVNASDKDGFTALSCALTSSCTSTFHMLVNAGADLKGANAKGDTILHAAARLASNGEQFVRCVLKAGVDCNMVNKQQRTPLHIAAKINNVSAAQLLLQAGAAVDTADGRGLTPLHLAVYNHHHAVTQMLLAAGAAVDTADRDGCTPLHVAVYKDHHAVMQMLLAAGATVNALDTNQDTPLHFAAEMGATAAAQLLLKVGGADVRVADIDGATPLHCAAYCGHVDVARLLLEHGAAIEVQNDDLRTPLQEAVVKGHLNVVQLLLRWAPTDAAGLRAAVVLAAGSEPATDVLVYLLQQLAAVDQDQVLEVLQEVRYTIDPIRVTFAVVKALNAASTSADAVAAAQAAEARELSDKRLGLQQLIVGLARMQVQNRQHAQQQGGQSMQDVGQQGADHDGDTEMADAANVWDD